MRGRTEKKKKRNRIVRTPIAVTGHLRRRVPAKKRARRVRSDIFVRTLIAIGSLALVFNATTTDWPSIKHVDVRGEVRLTDSEVVSLAALDDTEKIWTPFVRRDRIAEALEGHPFIEHAEIFITGPLSLRIDITERRSVGAIDRDGYRLVFDRTGELIQILDPTKIYNGQLVRDIPPGLLRFDGVPLYSESEAWSIDEAGADGVATSSHPAILETQFARMIHLLQYIGSYCRDYENDINYVRFDEGGRLAVDCENRPQILLGRFDRPEGQFRHLLAVLADERFSDTERIICIDLSSVRFPHYHVHEEFYTTVERRAIESWQSSDDDSQVVLIADNSDEELSESEEGESGVENDSGIFRSTGEVD